MNNSEVWGRYGEVLTLPEVADLFHVHPNTVRYWLKMGKMQGFKLGGHWRFWKYVLKGQLDQKGEGDVSRT